MLHLASSSPRRRELLQRAGIAFRACEPGEEIEGEGAPIELARQRALSKARGARAPADAWVLGVDTVVDVDGVELGKPLDATDAARMLRTLSGRIHAVHTAHALRRGERVWQQVATSRVRCAELDPAAIARYLESGEWAGKAGGYGVQSAAADFLTVVEGDVDTVIGLSVAAVAELLRHGAAEVG